MFAILRPAVVLLVLLTALTGLGYPLAITGLAGVIAPHQAAGSLVMRNGEVMGSGLIGQSFTSARYVHGRPSATTPPYDASASTGSNLGPSSRALKDAMADRVAALGVQPAPADLVTASGSGLDPHLSPAGALAQVERVAAARGLSEAEVRVVVERHIEPRALLFGEPRVNVLAVNLALDELKP